MEHMLERLAPHDWSFSATAESVVGALLVLTLALTAVVAVLA
jgi:hypothetical protein